MSDTIRQSEAAIETLSESNDISKKKGLNLLNLILFI